MKKLVIINGSPRGEKGATGTVINDMHPFISETFETVVYHDGNKEVIYDGDVILFVFPLYVDSPATPLTYLLEELEENKDKFKKDAKVSAFVLCGLYEGQQAHVAIDIIKNWTKRIGVTFVQGAGFGGSGALPMAKKQKPGEGIKEQMPEVFERFFKAVETEIGEENIYGTISTSREEYQQSSERGWRILVKRNGLTEEDLDRRL